VSNAVAERTITYVNPRLREVDLPEYGLLRTALYDAAMNSTHTSSLMNGGSFNGNVDVGRTIGRKKDII